MARYSEKQSKWTQDYLKNAYERLTVWVPKGDREKYKEFAKSQGKSLNQLIKDLLDKEMGSE